jgi:outer membrane protein assembly factor BamB
MQGNKDVLTAMDADTGKVLWSQWYVVTHRAIESQAQNSANGLPLPEATPTIDGDRIYTYGGGGDLACRKLADGKGIWGFNVLDQTGAQIIRWNEGSSPLVTDKLVYVQGGQGGAVAVAYDKNTGKIAWKSETGIGGYAAPILVDVKGTPDGHLFITTAYGHGCAMLAVTPTGATIEWSGKQISSKYQPCILDDGKLIGNSNGTLKCLQWPTQTTLWSTRAGDLGDGGSFTIAGNKIVAMSQDGKLSLIQFDANGAKLVNEVKVFNGGNNIWSDPVIYHGKLYVKGTDELVCFDIAAK